MMIFQFPGQGSQAIGMGAGLAEEFAAARAVFAEVDEALGQNLSGLMRNGPGDTLTLTENAQPALMAVSLAVMRVLEAEFGVGVDRAAIVCGHSLGEYSALTAAGALSLADSARLLKLRGQAMQRAVAPGAGAMASLIGLIVNNFRNPLILEGFDLFTRGLQDRGLRPLLVNLSQATDPAASLRMLRE